MSDYEIKEWLNQKSRIAKLEAALAAAAVKVPGVINRVSDVEPAYRKLLMTNAVVRHAWQTAMENDFTNEETLKYIICATSHVIEERIKNDLEKLNTSTWSYSTNPLAAVAVKVPEEVMEAAKRLDRYLEIGELYCLTDAGTVSDFILQLAGKDGK